MSITAEDYAFADEVTAFEPTSFYGGSFIVKGGAASDIDIVIPQGVWPRVREHFGSRIEKVQRDVPVEMEAVVPDDERLVCVYRRGSVDLIVVADAYVGSYTKAIAAMRADPDRYAERPARVALHVHFADEVRLQRGLPLEAEIKAAGRGHAVSSYEASKP